MRQQRAADAGDLLRVVRFGEVDAVT